MMRRLVGEVYERSHCFMWCWTVGGSYGGDSYSSGGGGGWGQGGGSAYGNGYGSGMDAYLYLLLSMMLSFRQP